jgi:hypothetical protein
VRYLDHTFLTIEGGIDKIVAKTELLRYLSTHRFSPAPYVLQSAEGCQEKKSFSVRSNSPQKACLYLYSAGIVPESKSFSVIEGLEERRRMSKTVKFDAKVRPCSASPAS